MAVSHSFTGPADTDPELHLLAVAEPISPRRLMPAAIGSLIFPIVVVTLWVTLPEGGFERYRATTILPDVRKSVRIVAPRLFELTQKEPNQGKVRHELDINSMRQGAKAQT